MPDKILLIDPLFALTGGGVTVAVWALEALRHDYDVTLLSWLPLDCDVANTLFGTDLHPEEFVSVCPSSAVRRLWDAANRLDPDPYGIQRWALLMRIARPLAPRFDAVISTNGEIDVGTRCLHYIHYPYLNDARPRADRSEWLARLRPWRLVSGFSYRRMRNNVFLTNSDWTGRKTQEFYDVPAHTVYPPVPGRVRSLPWAERKNGFVCVGRFAPPKNLDWLIDIVAKVREKYPEFHLHLIGMKTPDEPHGESYYQQLVRRVRDNADWLFMEESVSRDTLMELLSTHRYGLHAMVDEHFGIAVAEMVKAGCVVFTHNSGGQVEIVGDERLLYVDVNDAVRRILEVLDNEAVQHELIAKMDAQRQLFSELHFVAAIKAHVAAFIDGQTQTPASS